MKRLKIAIVGWAGSVHVERWSKGLSRRGYEIKVISLGGEPIDGVATAIIPRSGKFSYFTGVAQAVKEIKEFAPDIVHAHYATGNAWWGMKANIRPLVVSVWGSDVMQFPSNLITRTISKRILARADHICATNRLLKRVTCEIYPPAENKIAIIPFGVQLPDSPPAWPVEGPFRICFAKALLPIYGPDILLSALAEVVREVPDIELSLAGRGSMEKNLKRLVEESGLGERVSFVGQIPYHEIYSFIQRHHLMIMPSRMESFGVAVLEAGACARPVIASDIGGVPELLINQETGVLVPVGDVFRLAETIINFAQKRSLGQKMGLSGYHHVAKNFSWGSSLDRMSELYQSLAG